MTFFVEKSCVYGAFLAMFVACSPQQGAGSARGSDSNLGAGQVTNNNTNPSASQSGANAVGDPSLCPGGAVAALSIIGGAPVCPSSAIAKQTIVLFQGGVEACTATLIGPNQLVTAGHCVEGGVPNLQIGYIGAPQAVVATASDSFDDGSQGNNRHGGHDDQSDDADSDSSDGSAAPLTPAQIAAEPAIDPNLHVVMTVYHPAFDQKLADGSSNEHQDIGMIVFSGTIPVPVTTIGNFADFPINQQQIAADSSPNLYKSGAGAHSDEDESNDDDIESAILPVASVDSAHGELTYVPGLKKGTCDGDSGGPGFVLAADKLKLVGITSRGPDVTDAKGNVTEAPCDNGNGIDTDARYYRGWLTCAANKIQTLVAAQTPVAGLALNVEAGDTSASYCAQTLFQTPAQLIATSKAACLAQANMTFDSQTGDCNSKNGDDDDSDD